MIPLVVTMLIVMILPPAGPPDARKPDVVIEVSVQAGRPTFTEKGKGKPGPIAAVVGKTVRWSNLDSRPQHFVSTTEVDGKPVIDTGVIEPGAYYDLPLNNDMYRRLGGKTGGVVTVTFRSRARQPDPAGELQILSPAKR
jgi:hypothetical protein